jgi:membrane-associated phospholipid phosphatase
MSCIVIAGLMVQILCALVNVWWKISTHMAAIGGVAGALMAFAELFSFNPVWWLSLLFILSGILGSSRLILRQHTLLQVVVGFFLGVFCGMISILFL